MLTTEISEEFGRELLLTEEFFQQYGFGGPDPVDNGNWHNLCNAIANEYPQLEKEFTSVLRKLNT